MLNIIVYEDNIVDIQKNVKAINMAFAHNDIEYRICKFKQYNQELDNLIKDKDQKKIYILDIEMNSVSGIELASRIREVDYDSVIIFVTAYDKYKNDVFYNRLMALDFVCKNQSFEERLKEDIKTALKKIYTQNIFVFKYNHVIYRIPYSSINYIEKEPLIKRCIIHTTNNNFYIVNSIENILESLNDDFLRTHKSCIVNTSNIRQVDFSNNIITFKNGDKTSLLTEKMKKEVKEFVGVN